MAEAYPATSTDVIKMVTMSLGLAYFIYKICSDAWASLMSKPHTMWIPGKALVLSALTLQILTYLDYGNVSVSELPDPNQAMVLFGDQLMIDSGRLVICVFIGYLLPAMARPGSAKDWTDIAALAISVFSAVISELYYIHKTTKYIQQARAWKDSEDLWALQKLIHTKAWFIGSSIAILVSTVMLILFLVSAIIAGKTLRGLLTQRILHVMKLSSEWSWDKFKEKIISGKCLWNDFEDEMMRSWLLCHVGQPPYVIARSVLSSSTGLMVTACITLVVIKGIVVRYFRSFIPPHNDGWDWLRHITFSLQCAFVLMGWMVICWRWWSAVLGFSRFLSRHKSNTMKSISELRQCQRRLVDDFWTRSIHELEDVYDLHPWRQTQYKPPRKGEGIILSIVTKFKLYRLLVLCRALQILLVVFSKGCWFVSEMLLILLGFKFMCSCMRRGDKSCPCSGNEDIFKALEQTCMPGESAESLWFASAKSFKQAKDRLAYKAYGNQANGASPWHDLKALLQPKSFVFEFVSDGDGDKPKSFVDSFQQLETDEKYKLLIKYYPFLQENNWKMIAVSLLEIIIKVFIFYEGIDHPLANVVEAYNQAWEFITFVSELQYGTELRANPAEDLDIEVDQVSVAADKKFKKLQQFPNSSNYKLLTAKEAIEKLRNDAEKELNVEPISASKTQQTPQGRDEENLNHKHAYHSEHLQDSKDWNEVARNYYMYKVCKLVLETTDSSINVSGLLDELHLYIAEVIGKCLLKLPESLVTRCRKWAVEYNEDDIWDALSTAGKAISFMKEMWPPTQQPVQSN